jgi:hypothetical protein
MRAGGRIGVAAALLLATLLAAPARAAESTLALQGGPSGFVGGLTVPMFALDQAHDLARGGTEGIELYPFPKSLAICALT